MLCLFLFVLFLLLFLFSFFSDNNMTSIGTVEFKYSVVIIILVNLGKPSGIGD